MSQPDPSSPRNFLGVFSYSKRALLLVWETSRTLAWVLGALTLVAGLLPAGIAYVGQLIVDAVVATMEAPSPKDLTTVYTWVGVEAALVIVLAGTQRGIAAAQSLLRALLGQRVNEMILDKAQTLSLKQFEDSEFYDKLTRARREASQRPL
ncbi:MAG: ABC transporter ATP-binding protein, partial [Litorivicinus sp.]